MTQPLHFVFTLLIHLAFLGLLLWAGLSDYKTRTIPNLCTLFLLILSVGYAVYVIFTGTVADIIAQFILLPLSVVLFIFWTKGKMGGGDVKLLVPSMLFYGIIWFFAAFLVSIVTAFIAGNKMKTKIPLATYFFIGAAVATTARMCFLFL